MDHSRSTFTGKPPSKGRMKIICAFGVAMLASSLVLAQAPEPKLEFEVASVRKSDTSSATDNAVALGLRMDGAQARIGRLTLRDYIGMAWRVKTYQILGPDWLGTERFDINAKLPAGATADQIPRMLQSLITERFGLKF